MKATQLYTHLEKDFIVAGLSDDWKSETAPIKNYVCENFKKRSMGLVCDFSDEIFHVFSAVFPSDKVMQTILERDMHHALLFVHHPATWDIRTAPQVFIPISSNLLKQFKDRSISIYNLHVPLDNFGPYATSVTLANALGISIEKPFAPYFGALCGVIGKTDCKTVQDLQQTFSHVIGHETKLYPYGFDDIPNGMVAVAAGGGNNVEVTREMLELGVNVLITGITIKNAHSQTTHEFEDRHGISVLGGTHYSTEKFACQAFCSYFESLGLLAEFIEDAPVMEDM